jgi:drug/metabolite transporter (DMT)-like permease
VSVYIYFESVVTVLLGVTLLHEQLTWQSVLGSLTIAGSIVLVNWLKRSGLADRENVQREEVIT